MTDFVVSSEGLTENHQGTNFNKLVCEIQIEMWPKLFLSRIIVIDTQKNRDKVSDTSYRFLMSRRDFGGF